MRTLEVKRLREIGTESAISKQLHEIFDYSLVSTGLFVCFGNRTKNYYVLFIGCHDPNHFEFSSSINYFTGFYYENETLKRITTEYNIPTELRDSNINQNFIIKNIIISNKDYIITIGYRDELNQYLISQNLTQSWVISKLSNATCTMLDVFARI